MIITKQVNKPNEHRLGVAYYTYYISFTANEGLTYYYPVEMSKECFYRFQELYNWPDPEIID